MDRRDYEEPVCPFDTSMWSEKPPVSRIPVDRVIEKEDEYLSKDDFPGAERHLLYWLGEALAGNDVRGRFAVENELMGIYRKTGKEVPAVEHARAALSLISEEEIGAQSTAAATAYTNAATVYKVFGQFEEAIGLYERALPIYQKELKAGDGRMGGLWNNMALVLADLGRFEEALRYYGEALRWMDGVKNGALEQGMTYLNICDCLMKRDAKIVNNRNEETNADDPEASLAVPKETDEAIENYLDLAWDKLNDPAVPANGYYAYVIRQSAPSFRYYGRENMAVALERMAEEIYEANA